MSERSIDRITLVYLDGMIIARCYSGRVFSDAKLSLGCLANLVGDGGKIIAAVYQDSAASNASSAETPATGS